MTQCLFSRRSGALGVAIALAVLVSGLAAAPAPADLLNVLGSVTTTGVTAVNTAACTNPPLGQPFTWAGDANWYTLPPGQSPDQFSGAGWALGAGAKIVTTKLRDGQTGTVLDLPSGAYAVSPYVCVTTAYPTARALVRDVRGSEGIQFTVSYKGSVSGLLPADTAQIRGGQGSWILSSPLSVQPGINSGWQIVRFGFQASGIASEFQLYDFFVDPRMKP
jgi:hypothetical protein